MAESWRTVWRIAAPLLSTRGLEALAVALETEDERLVRGCITNPPPATPMQHWEPHAACLIGYCGWQGDGLATVEEVDEFFARVCAQIDSQIGEPGGCRFLLNWWDGADGEDWDMVRDEMLPEVRSELSRRYRQEGEACVS